MRTKILLFTAILTTALVAFRSAPDNYTILPDASNIKWVAEKVTGSHDGSVQLKEGSIQIENNALVGGSFVIDMNTISVEDLSGSGKEKLEGHLNSKDFFSVDKYPEARFVIKSVEMKKQDEFDHVIKGDLSIKGITKPIEFPASIKITDGKFAAFGEMTIDRTLYDIRYGSSSFFDDLGDRTIYDDFVMTISIGASL